MKSNRPKDTKEKIDPETTVLNVARIKDQLNELKRKEPENLKHPQPKP